MERAWLGNLEAAPGDNLTVRLSRRHGVPTLDVEQASAAADRIDTYANAARGFAADAYFAALLLLVGLFRQRDVPPIRAEAASRHGGA